MTNKEIIYTTKYIRNYKKRIKPNPQLKKLTKIAVGLFLEDRTHPQLNDHKLISKLTYARAFSVAPNCRIVYRDLPDAYVFEDIGSHSEVYLR